MNFRSRSVIVTGGSSGIGLEIARELGRLGARLHLFARDVAKLDAARRSLLDDLGSDASIDIHSVDVADEAAVRAAVRAVGESGTLAALICNAGIIRVGRFEDLHRDDFDAVLRTNYLGALDAIAAAWPYLKRAGESRIGLVSSVAGYTGLYGYSAYAPSKFAMTGLAECLRMEGKRDGIRVTIVFPPDTETPMLEYERAHAPAETRALTAGASRMSAPAVARKFVAGMVRGDFEVYGNFESRLIRVVKALAPRAYGKLLDRLASG